MPEKAMESLLQEDQLKVKLCKERSPYEGDGIVIAHEETDEPSRDTLISVRLADNSVIRVRIAACCNPNDVITNLGIAMGYFETPKQKSSIRGRALLEKAFGNGTFNPAKVARA